MQITELKFDDFHKIRSLFTRSKHLKFTIEAVIAGNSPMSVWVDSEETPKSAFLWDHSHCYYFGGDAGNQDFCDTIENILNNIIIPEVIKGNREVFKIEFSPKEWELILMEILRDNFPFKISRKFFTLDTPLIPRWRDLLPPDFDIKRIDRNLLESDTKNVERIIDEITGCWYSIDDFLTKGFGFCLIYNREESEEVQGWCTGEYFSEGKCGIGIETFQGYQERGLATVMASAFVEHSLSINIHPHWDASSDNHASIRVAEKVGFRPIQDYSVLFGTFKKL